MYVFLMNYFDLIKALNLIHANDFFDCHIATCKTNYTFYTIKRLNLIQ